jgi:hypothetical protein
MIVRGPGPIRVARAPKYDGLGLRRSRFRAARGLGFVVVVRGGLVCLRGSLWLLCAVRSENQSRRYPVAGMGRLVLTGLGDADG